MRFISILLVSSVGYATELAPWFSPLLEFQGRAAFLYERIEKVQSPLGDFKAPSDNASLQLGLNLTPFPYLNAGAEIFLTQTSRTDFSLEAALFTLRYAWLDDIAGDCITLVTGATVAFPSHRFLHEFGFAYHGNTNVEFHAAIGKEYACCQDWCFRAWGLGGFGVANRGSPWVHAVAVVEGKIKPCTSLGLFLDALYGLGSHNIIPNAPFKGYASIRHQSIDLGSFVSYYFPYFGTFTFLGWYNVHARNFAEHYWGLGLSVLIPFSLI